MTAATSSASFDTPAQWDGRAQVQNAKWAVLVLAPSDTAEGMVELTGGILATQFDAVKTQVGDGVFSYTQSTGSTEAAMEGGLAGSLELPSGNWKSLYIVAEEIHLNIGAMGEFRAHAVEQDLSASLVEESYPTGALRSHKIQQDSAVLATRPSPSDHPYWTLEAKGITELEVHNGTLACSAGQCPRHDPSRAVVPAPSPARMEVLTYLNLKPRAGNASFSGSAWNLAAGAGNLDVHLSGDARLPGLQLPETCNETSCVQADGQTLRAVGNLTFTGMRWDGLEPRRLQGSIQIEDGEARLDESNFDASLLGPIAAVAAATAIGIGGGLLAIKLLLSLFTRVKEPAALAHPNRRLLFDAVGRNPGISFSQLRRVTGLPNGTARHHLETLVTLGLLQTKQLGITLRYYPAETNAAEQHGLALLQDSISRQICSAIHSSPGITQTNLCKNFLPAVPRSSVQFKLGTLVAAGILTSKRVGREVQYSPGASFLSPARLNPLARTSA